jgi:PEP-CTERM motif
MMNRLTKYLGAVSLAFVTAQVQAVPLSDLIAGGTISSGDKLFENWELFSVTDPEHSAGIQLHLIEVTAIGDGSAGNAYGLNFDFGGQFALGDQGEFDFMDLNFGYSATATDADKVITSAMMSAVGAASGDDAFFTVQKDAYDAAGDSIWGPDEFMEVYDDTMLGTELSDSAALPGLGTVWIEDNIALYFDSFFGDSGVLLASFEQRFGQRAIRVPVPAPGTLVLFALGLLGLSRIRGRQ